MALLRSALALLGWLAAMRVTTAAQVIMGVAYGPTPVKVLGATITSDDFMSEDAKPLWGRRGRGDLALLRGMGANTVRTYGNNNETDHSAFLNEALLQGLQVIPGMSDYPYIQMRGNCMTTGYNCFTQMKDTYLGNLQNGFLLANGNYHPAIMQVVVINEPDLKIPGMVDPFSFTKGIISAIDGMLEAEKLANVVGVRVNFTVAFSFAICSTCRQSATAGSKPALGQMIELRRGMLQPAAYNYTARNDLATFYRTRFTNCFNTANPAADMPTLIFNAYPVEFPTTPVFIGEFHSTAMSGTQEAELTTMLTLAQSKSFFRGINFFEFQVSYHKGGDEMAFGMFGLGTYNLQDMNFFGTTLSVWCLTPVTGLGWVQPLPNAVARAYGGTVPAASLLCQPDPDKVPLTSDGFLRIRSLLPTRLVDFVARAVRSSGGAVVNQAGLAQFTATTLTFGAMVTGLVAQPTWAKWDPLAACVADRNASFSDVGAALNIVCNTYNCSRIPATCSAWAAADYALSVYYNRNGGSPLQTCYFNGAATFAASPAYGGAMSGCVVTKNPLTTPITEEGFQAIVSRGVSVPFATFINRVVAQSLNAVVSDQARLRQLASSPPNSLYDLLNLLRGASWVCTGRGCVADAELPPLTDDTFQQIFAQRNNVAMAAFVARAAAFYGGTVQNSASVLDLAGSLVSMQQLVSELTAQPSWATWNPSAACVLDPRTDAGSPEVTVQYACRQGLTFSCSNFPTQCNSSVWDKANYMLSLYNIQRNASLPTCYSDGAFIFAQLPGAVGNSQCIVSRDAATTALSEEGYQLIRAQGDVVKVAVFMQRFAALLGAVVSDESQLLAYAASPASTFAILKAALLAARWVCVGNSTICPAQPNSVPLTDVGYLWVQTQGTERIAGFILRVAEHLGGDVWDREAMLASVGSAANLSSLVLQLQEEPEWGAWNGNMACTLDRGSSSAVVGLSIEYACFEIDCARIPSQCTNNVWDTAAYVLSMWSNVRALSGSVAKPPCYYRGALIFVDTPPYGGSPCALSGDPLTAPLIEEGYQAVLRRGNPSQTAVFIFRFTTETLGREVLDEAQLQAFAQEPPSSLANLTVRLSQAQQAQWICAGTNLSCIPDPALMPLTDASYQQVLARRNATLTAAFVVRVAKHFGGNVSGTFNANMVSSATTLAGLVTLVQQKPAWATWDDSGLCQVPQYPGLAASASIGKTINYVCNQMSNFSCVHIPYQCNTNAWDAANYALSVYAQAEGRGVSPVCFTGGTLIYARASVPSAVGSPKCVVTNDPATTPLTEEGYQSFNHSDIEKMVIFIQRIASELMGARITDEGKQRELAANPPPHMSDLYANLLGAWWLCGGSAASPCGEEDGHLLGWQIWSFVGLAGFVLLAVLGTIVHVALRPKEEARWRPVKEPASEVGEF